MVAVRGLNGGGSGDYGGDNAEDDTAVPLWKKKILENLYMRLPEPDNTPYIF